MKGTKKRGLNLQQEKLWNHLSNYMLKKAGYKSSHPTTPSYPIQIEKTTF